MAETRFQEQLDEFRERLEHANHDLMEAQSTIQEAEELLDDLEELDQDHTAHLAEYNRWNTKALIRLGNNEPHHIVNSATKSRDTYIKPILGNLDAQLNKTWDLLDVTKRLEALIEYPADIFQEIRQKAAVKLQVAEKTYKKQKERMNNLHGKLK